MTKHPTQPSVMDGHGVLRFKSNAIVQYLLDAGPFDMNHLAKIRHFTDDDRRQFAQLIGYSVSGYGDLSYAEDEVQVDALLSARNQALEEAARTPVLATNKLRNSNKDYSEGWFDGVEACLEAIRALKVGE